ncbi:MAG: hypothetical protein JXK93_04590, partial [Sphaerochaetaceae bacterium]|nr:hypothetical protein [Sphaerochaetaceae bacterium]
SLALVLAGETALVAVLAMIGWLVVTGLFSTAMDLFGLESNQIIETWLIPCGFSALVPAAAFVSVKRFREGQSLVQTLCTLFIPILAVLLLVLSVARILTSGNASPDRDLLILIDGILILVISCMLISPVRRPKTVFFYLELILIASALILDLTALISIASRLIASGLTPNKVTALGLNILIFLHLCRLGRAYLVNTGDNGIILRAKTGFLPLYALWCVLVVYVFPFLFRFR